MKHKRQQRALFIFRRDLRLDDNTGLIAALKKSEVVIPCFIFDPLQISQCNRFRSLSAVQFMVESLRDLDLKLKRRGGRLYMFYGPPDTVVRKLLNRYHIDLVCMNRDYTPYSCERDQRILDVCASRGVACESYDDVLLHAPGSIVKNDQTPYTIFTPFFKRAVRAKIRRPESVPSSKFFSQTMIGNSPLFMDTVMPSYNKNIFVHGGRGHARTIFKHFEKFMHYAVEHDFPALEKTTGLSAHLKFGTCSVREVYYAMVQKLGSSHPLVRQLYWRDFFTQIAFHFPQVFGAPFYKKYETLSWQNNKKKFAAWCDGKTGFPIVDAGMRQLNATGFMHNRVRMIVASFLVKDLHIDWRWGERYFATKLVDYDPAVNNGNWQWAASTGCDAQPYFRIFNPWLQQKKFDRDCVYIQRWVRELRSLSPRMIHALFKHPKDAPVGYPAPIVDHDFEVRVAKASYAKAICKAKKLGVH
ncbi:MAG: deoxyribodipyrimidine photo-lyase [Candidatus Babeliales bacterium]|jgi:deoxyribodipyrimidine photo-lyase